MINIEMVKRMEKIGQTGNFATVLWIVGIIILAGFGYFAYNASDFFGNVGENVPSKVEFATQGCIGAANGNLVDSYCSQIREVGNNRYVTCAYGYDNKILPIGAEVHGLIAGACDKAATDKGIGNVVVDRNFADKVRINDQTAGDFKIFADQIA